MTEHAPGYVVPADRNWVRDGAVFSLLESKMRGLGPQIPDPDPALRGIKGE